MFVLVSSVIVALTGTLISLRLSWIDTLEGNNNLTRRGRIVFALAVGLSVGIVIFLVDGMWWECTPDNVCKYVWKI